MNKTDLIIETMFIHEYLENNVGLEPDTFDFVQRKFIEGCFLFDLMRKGDLIEYGKYLNKTYLKNEVELLHYELLILMESIDESLVDQK